jgi:hypothetical protein
MTASLYIGGIFFLICMYFIIMMFIHPQYYLDIEWRLITVSSIIFLFIILWDFFTRPEILNFLLMNQKSIYYIRIIFGLIGAIMLVPIIAKKFRKQHKDDKQ